MTTSNGFCILLTTKVIPYIFPNLKVVSHLVVPADWGSCLPRLAILHFDDPFTFAIFHFVTTSHVLWSNSKLMTCSMHWSSPLFSLFLLIIHQSVLLILLLFHTNKKLCMFEHPTNLFLFQEKIFFTYLFLCFIYLFLFIIFLVFFKGGGGGGQ